MTVGELIAKLQTFPEHLLVCYMRCSEQCLLEDTDLSIIEAGLPRPDGWIQNKRPDKPTKEYLAFPGN